MEPEEITTGNLTEDVRQYIRMKARDIYGTEPLVGIVPRERFLGMIDVSPEDILPEAQSVIVLAKGYDDNRIAYKRSHPNSFFQLELYQFNQVTATMLVNSTAGFLERKGYRTVPMANHCRFSVRENPELQMLTTLSYDKNGELQGREEFYRKIKETRKALPLKTLAVMAGLGEIGLNDCLITPEYGPRVALSIIITSARLEPDQPFTDTICPREKCNRCVEVCPVGAIKREGYDYLTCLLHFTVMQGTPVTDVIKRADEAEKNLFLTFASFIKTPIVTPCRTACVSVCPVGKKHHAGALLEFEVDR
ncbi:MAG: epoxyqueuosine reductase [Dehalococcoidales bacterium]|nr:epoxyqueuosine reductase [Dehalococcoidales bacterium]